MSWASVVMANGAEERAVVMASMNAIGQAIAAGTQVVQWPATSAPNFQTGFRSALGTTVAQLLMVAVILFFSSRDLKQRVKSGKVDEA
jgi:ACS family pantothenate transporter-like MFS transporter